MFYSLDRMREISIRYTHTHTHTYGRRTIRILYFKNETATS